jgi:WhiB family redox-sensing transcriptional regulator
MTYQFPRDAACKGVEPETFYPLDDRPGSPGVEAARAICLRCPVLLDCLLDADATEDKRAVFGVRAGLAAEQRRQLYRTPWLYRARQGA